MDFRSEGDEDDDDEEGIPKFRKNFPRFSRRSTAAFLKMFLEWFQQEIENNCAIAIDH